MFMKRPFLAAVLVSAIAFSCGSDSEQTNIASDTQSAKDSLKAQVTENLPPSEDFKQFEWIYSSFVAAATYTVKSTDVFVNKDAGLWVITSNGAMPQMVHVTTTRGLLNYKNDTLIPIDRDPMICTLLNEEIPKPDCDSKTFWSKNGCFTSENNTFKDEKIWDYAGLNESDEKAVEELAGKIDRVVVNTALNMRMYFMMENGSWYLVFLDLRMPCEA